MQSEKYNKFFEVNYGIQTGNKKYGYDSDAA